MNTKGKKKHKEKILYQKLINENGVLKFLNVKYMNTNNFIQIEKRNRNS